jgi:CheY-like chemotaxis protein/two-component sensor histidine kinase
MAVVSLNSLVNDFMRIAQKFVGREIETKVVLPEKLPLAKVDVAQMNQVLLNLVMNAREAMPDKGVLEIMTSKESVDEADCRFHIGVKPGPYVVLTVRDSGTGIDQETTRKIFEPFFTTKKSDGRKGLGLSVVYGIVKQHGGFIDVLSEKGKGATFKVYIPVTREKAGEIKSGEKPAKAGGETILVAEDEKSLRDVASDILRKLGYKVLVAPDGLKAVDIFRERQNDIDCVMLDIVMPRLNGRETYREIEKIRPGTPVVFVTGYSLEGIQTSFIVEEGFDAIQKPYTLDVIGKKIREVLDRKKIG